MGKNLSFYIYYTLLIFGTISCFGVGTYTFFKDIYSKTIRTFFFLCLASGIFAGGEAIGTWYSVFYNNEAEYLFWARLNVAGGFIAVPLFINLILIISGREKIIKNIIYILYVWGISILYVFIVLFTDIYFYFDDEKFINDFYAMSIGLIHSITLFVLCIYFSYKGFKSVKSSFRKKQLTFLFYGLMIPIITAALWFSVLFVLNLSISNQNFQQYVRFNVIAISLGIGMVTISIGILKYGTFIHRRTILDILFAQLAQLVIVVEKTGRIILINNFTSFSLKFEEIELIDTNVKDLMENGQSIWNDILQNLAVIDMIMNKKIVFSTKEKKQITFLVTVSLMKNQIILVGKNIEDMVEYEKKLEIELLEKTKQLEVAKELSIMDGLTGCYNRRKFDEDLQMELARASLEKEFLSLLMIDVDWFKHYNDFHGHLKGDELLKKLVSLLIKNVRRIDKVYRYGGEEFTVLLPKSDRESAILVAERIKKIIEQENFEGEQESQPNGSVTISIGISIFPSNAQNKADFIKIADEALYKSKQTGRNKVSIIDNII